MRPEPSGGSRLLLCLGTTEQREVPVLPVDFPEVWSAEKAFGRDGCTDPYYWFEGRRTSTDFQVIGEVFMPTAMRDKENQLGIWDGEAVSDDLRNEV
jgi:hypothetical protein